MTKPTVSICILCYNQSNIIGQTIQSALDQTYPADEIVVIDDGSQDDSVERISQFPEVRLIRHPYNKGRPQARNTLLYEAKGDILVYIDGDAFADPGMLTALLSEYGPPDVGGVGGGGVEANIRTIYDRWRKRHATQELGPDRLESADFLWGLCYSYPRNVIIEAGGYPTVGEDVDLSRRVRRLGYRLVYTPKAIVYHQRTDNLRSLLKMIYRWWYGGYIADANSGEARVHLYLLDIIREFTYHNYKDVIAQPDWEIAWINYITPFVQFKAFVDAVRDIARET